MKRAQSNDSASPESKTTRIDDGNEREDDVMVIHVEGTTETEQVITLEETQDNIVIEDTEYIEEITDTVEAANLPSDATASDPSIRIINMIKVLPPGNTTLTSRQQVVRKPPAFAVAMGNTSKSQKAARPASMKSSSLLSLMASVAAQSAIANAAQSTPKAHVIKPAEPIVNEAWHESLKAIAFSDVKEEDVVTWINVEGIQKSEESKAHWMLNPSRKVCVFVNFSLDNKGKRVPQYLCNFCKLTENSFSGILQHLNHHLFVCGTCPYYSSTRFDVELHRQRVGHMLPLSDGYIVHKQGTSMCSQKLKVASKNSKSTNLLEWLPIQEETESLIIMDSEKPPESARRAFFNRNPVATASEIEALDVSTSVVCALPYYRYVQGKSNRKHVLEFHCNFCQSTPAFTQELYRHIDFHALDCPTEGCEFRSFTRLELHLHQRQEHEKQARDFLKDLVMLVPLMAIDERNLVDNASMYHAKWSVVLKLPNVTEIPGSNDFCNFRNTSKELEYRCTICNIFVINKGGMASHLKMHNIQAKEYDRYMEAV